MIPIVVQALYFEGKNLKIPDFQSANIRAFTFTKLGFSYPQTLKMKQSSYSCYILKFVSIHATENIELLEIFIQ